MILCIDPGLRGVGIAHFNNKGELQSAAYVHSPKREGRGYLAQNAAADAAWKWWGFTPPELTLIEHPRVYPGMPDVDLNDLLDVAGVGASCALLFGNPRTVFPSEWKGNVKKDVMTERIRGKLDPLEFGRIEGGPKHLMHNALDAVGIGLWHFKRLNQKIYPGATP